MAEHAYQWRKCQIFEREDLALRVLCAKTPREARETVAELTDVNIWTDDVKVLAMKCVLVAKFQTCQLFRARLLDCKNKIIAEATSATFWGAGASPGFGRGGARIFFFRFVNLHVALLGGFGGMPPEKFF